MLRAGSAESSAAAQSSSTAHADRHDHADHHHHHSAESVFVKLSQPVRRAAIAQRLQRCIDAAAPGELLRIKGILRADDGLAFTVQWSPGDECAAMVPFSGELPACGLTVIASSSEAAAAATRVLGAAR